ncbi:MAG: DMT family transporter [Alphaproteobacteria bacterium]|nr:DMT family transporter [Alphaproteobacteria bacterium]
MAQHPARAADAARRLSGSASESSSAGLALWAAAGTGVQVGLAIVASRFTLSEISPATLALLRYGVGFLFLAPAAWRAGLMPFAWRDTPALTLLGVGQFGVLVVLLNLALLYIPSASAALLFATFPFMTMLLAAALGLERVTRVKATAVLLTIVGVGFTLGAGALTLEIGADLWIGAGFALASAFSGALCSVFYRRYLQRYPTVQVSAYAMLATVVFLVPWAWGEGGLAAATQAGAAAWAAVLFIGASSALGYFLWLYALRRASPTRVTVFLALSPATAALVGFALLGEPLTAGTTIGVGLVALGLALIARRPDR